MVFVCKQQMLLYTSTIFSLFHTSRCDVMFLTFANSHTETDTHNWINLNNILF